jgi:hypothetical protein
MKRLTRDNLGSADAKRGGRREWKCLVRVAGLAHLRTDLLRRAVGIEHPCQLFRLVARRIPSIERRIFRSGETQPDGRE